MSVKPINGADLYFESTGEGDPALFIHGMCGNASVWDEQVKRLSGSMRCVTYDRRGHTRSSLGDVRQRTVELHADDAAALVRELDLAPCLLVASSGGARIGVDLLRRYPILFNAAVLSEPPIFGLDPEHGGPGIMADLQPPIGAAMRSGNPRAAVDAFFEYMCPGLWAQLDASGKEPYRANHVELMGDLEMPPYAITADDLRVMQTPATIVTGSISHPVLRRVAKVITGAMPHARLAELAGIGHVTYAEAPDAFAALVRERAGV
ncbi:MAG: alpha/beta hydrolase [Dehalococcoidia bacterium]